MASNYGAKNQYHPKASQEMYDQRKAHTWQIKGNFDGKQGRLNIYIYDATTGKEYEQYFTQQSFQNNQNLKIFDVANKTINAINTTMNGGIPMCTIQEWKGMAYLTIQGGQLPTLALPPKQQNKQQNQQNNFKQNQQFGQQKKK